MANARLRIQLLNIVTEYDRKQARKKYYSMYALAHYCRAVESVMAHVNSGESIEDSLPVGFCGSLLSHIAKKLGLTLDPLVRK